MTEVTTSFGILFTDIEGSTRRWEDDPAAMSRLVARHDKALADIVQSVGGRVVKGTGDGMLAVFPEVGACVRAAVEAQKRLWPDPPVGLGLPVRMAVHAGEVLERDGDVFGPEVIRCARLMGAGHGGQVLISEAAVVEFGESDLMFRDLGSHQLRGLADPIAIRQVLVPGLPSDHPPLRTLHACAHNLPSQLSSFVGRRAELREVPRLLAGHRLVTLCGPGGTGKTRLALQVASESLDQYTHGTWLIDLLRVGSGAEVAEMAAAQLGIDPGPAGPLAALTEAFATTETLLVVDNCEHVRRAAADVIGSLLATTSRLRVLATSREPLHVAGEVVAAVDPLPVPKAEDPADRIRGSAAVRLFLDRAAAAGQRQIGTEHLDLVGEVCRAVEGLPLAIELAAARTRYLSMGEIAGALPQQLDVLRSPSDPDPRHRTMRAAIGWSYQLLDPVQQLLLQRLAAFRNGWWREEAMAVCSAPPLSRVSVDAALDELVDHSLVAIRKVDGRATRFRLLEQVRHFAAEQAGDGGLDEFGDRLVDYYLDLLEAEGQPVLEPTAAADTAAVVRLAGFLLEDLSNLILAIESALDAGRATDALRILANGGWLAFYFQSGYSRRYLSWLDRGMPVVTGEDPVVALGALEGAVWAVSATIEQDTMLELQLEGLRRAETLEHEYGLIDALHGLGHAYYRIGRRNESRRSFQRAIERGRDRYPLQAQEAELAIAVLLEHSLQGYEPSRKLILAVSRGCPLSFWDWYFAATAMDSGHLEEALAACDRILASPVHRLMAVGVCHAQDRRGRILAMLGRQAEAEEAIERALEAARSIVGPNWAVPMAWEGAAVVAAYADDPARARHCLERGLEMARRGSIHNYVCRLALESIPYLIDQGDTGGAEALAVEAEQAMTVDGDAGPFYGPIIRLGLARVSLARGNVDRAARLVLDSLPTRLEEAPTIGVTMACLEMAALTLSLVGDQRARTVLAALDRWRVEAHMVENPTVERLRSRALENLPAQSAAEPIDLDEALDVARAALTSLTNAARIKG